MVATTKMPGNENENENGEGDDDIYTGMWAW